MSRDFATGFHHPIDLAVSPENHLAVANYDGTIHQITVGTGRLNVLRKRRSINLEEKLAVTWGRIKQ